MKSLKIAEPKPRVYIETTIVTEVRKARASLAKGFKDAHAYIEHLRTHPRPGRKPVSLPARKPIGIRKAG